MLLAEPAPAIHRASGRRPLRWATLFAIAAALAIILGAVRDRWFRAEPMLDPAALVAGYGPADASLAGTRADAAVAGARQHLALGPGQWLREEGLARALIARHRLTGDYADLGEADRLLAAGLDRTPDPAGPVLTRASLSLLLHRLPEAQAALARAARWGVPTTDEQADALALAGDIAQQRGDPKAAMRDYARAAVLAESNGIELRRSMLLARTGERDLAKAQLEALLARPRQSPRGLAELSLQRAQLAYAEGDWEGAARWVAAAERLFPGYWLADAYVAQTLALAGRRGEAINRYTEVATSADSPEAMDALALLLRLDGRRDESLAWWRRADALWRDRLARFPEAAALHAAEHALIGGRPDEALRLASADAVRRPYGASLAVLARVLILAGRPYDALAALDRAEAQGWVSAGLLMLRAEATAALGDENASAAAQARAEAINPRAADPGTRLIWFGHD
ncbi:MAG: hypothetical protein ABW203_08070 [Novosphingobium sp.]